MYGKGRRNILLLFANLPRQLVRFPRQLVNLSLVNLSLVNSSLVNLSTRLLVNLIQYSLNYAKKYIKFCRL